jgi:hypothetical protein
MKSKHTPETPTRGAIRAAMVALGALQSKERAASPAAIRLAVIIDRETAAPDLLEALREAVAAMREWGYGKTGVAVQCREAIAKAEGSR